MSRVLRAAPLMLNERSNILTSTEKPTTSKADPPDRGPHRTQARQPRVPCDICSQYGIIFTVVIPAVFSGATWTLSLQNFLWTCITQVQSTFATPLANTFLFILQGSALEDMSHGGRLYGTVNFCLQQ